MRNELLNYNLECLLGSAVSDVLEKAEAKKIKERQFALIITFNNDSKIKKFQSLVSPIAPNLTQYKQYLFGLFSSEELAQKTSNNIRDVIDLFDQKLIAQPFKSDWLDEYLDNKKFTVKYQVIERHLTSPDNIKVFLDKKNEDNHKQVVYKQKISAAKLASMSYSVSDMVSDFDDFFLNNFEGVDDRLASDLFAILEEDVANLHHFSSHPAQEIMYAMRGKAEHIFQDNLNGDQHAIMSEYQKKRFAEEKFKLLVESSSTYDRWKACAHKLTMHIKNQQPNLILKGLDALLANENAKVEPLQDFKSPFDLSYDMEIDINKRLSHKNLIYDIQGQGYELIEQVAGAVAAYYLTIKEYKQDMTFERMLVEHSRVMDKKPFFDHLISIAESSRSARELFEDASIESSTNQALQ